MAVTLADIQDAEQKRSAAESAVAEAQAKVAALAADPEKYAELNAAKEELRNAQTQRTYAQQEYTYRRNQYAKENPPKKPATPKTPGQEALDQGHVKDEAEKDQNEQVTGIRETNAQRATRERTEANQTRPRPATTPNAVQIANSQTQATNANTNIARQAATASHNQNVDQLAVVKAQADALNKAGMLYNTTRGQVSQEAQAQHKGVLDAIQEVRSAGTTLLDSESKERQRQLDMTKLRQDFIGTTLNTAMPKVLELMLKTEKGSKVAANFLKAYLVMANSAYQAAGLDQDVPAIDRNSPYFKNLMKIGGYTLPDEIPPMPTSDQISWRAAKATAVGGFPVPGYNGPVGVEATQLPDMPAGTNGSGVNVAQQAAQSPEGVAIKREIAARLKGIPTDPSQQTPEQRATVAAAQAELDARVKDLARKQQAAPRPPEHVAAANDLKQQVRSALISGDPNQRLRIMGAAQAAADNQAAGKPLTEDQTALLANLDPADLQIVQQHMTPQVRQILDNYRAGRMPTPEESALVQAAVTNVSTGIKNRPVGVPTPPEAPARVGPTATQQDDRQVDPNQVRAEQQAHAAQQAERQRIKAENPDLDAMMTQIEEEQRNNQGLTMDRGVSDTRPLREQAEERLRTGEKPRNDYYDQPGKLITPPRLSGPVFQNEGGGFGLPRPGDWEARDEGPPPMPKLLAPDYGPDDASGLGDSSDSYEPVRRPPLLLAPPYQQDDNEEEDDDPYRSSLFSPNFSWSY